jgi:hypothetical protein
MALVSPGVEVSVVDESQYVPAAAGTLPLIVVATAQNKTSGTGTGFARGTLSSAIGQLFSVTGQRDLVEIFGNPLFYTDASGNSLNGYDLNEYGLQAAYSMLGVTNRAYVLRADVDLAQLNATTVRPTGDVLPGTVWLDTINTSYGIFEWSAETNTFVTKSARVITNTEELVGGVPAVSVGTIGSYAVVATNTNNPVYFKNKDNQWVLVGSDSWKQSWPTVQSLANVSVTVGDDIIINGVTVVATGTDLSSLAADINGAAIPNVSATVRFGKLEIYSSVPLNIISGVSGQLADDLDIAATSGNEANPPALQQSSHTKIPAWRRTDGVTARPTGSVWVKTTAVNNGASFALKSFNGQTGSFSLLAAPLHENDRSANKALDPIGGGRNIATNSYYIQYDVSETDTATYKIYRRYAQGSTIARGLVNAASFTAGAAYTVQVSRLNSTDLTAPVEITLSGTTADSFVSDLLAANIDNISALVTDSGAVQIEHVLGGEIVLKETSGTPLADAGLTTALTVVKNGPDSTLVVSNWVPALYTASSSAPGTNPENGTLWYYGVTDEFDVMIHDGSQWRGYRNVGVDARGYDLTQTNINGPIVSSSEPTSQDSGSQLALGDIWVDTSDFENFPTLYRYEQVGSDRKWIQIDNNDSETENGIVFADARWGTDGTVNPISDSIPSIADLAESDYVDLDVVSPDLYPRGTLLFNTRRSGLNVKRYVSEYFTSDKYASTLPDVKASWVSAVGSATGGAAPMGRKAVRAVVVAAMKEALDTNQTIREEQREFNLIAAPGYPELAQNMVALNNERKNTSFVVVDTPMRLAPSDVENWSLNANGAVADGEDGLITNDPYMGVYWPSALTTSLNGQQIVVPASHGVLRTIARSDDQSYPWFAFAGTRRGRIDNISSLGYINADSGNFVTTQVREGVRDVLYSNNINPLTFEPGIGNMNWGNKTRSGTASSLDRVNVARLVAYIRRQLDKAAKPFIFEPNDKLTRDEFKGIIEQFLNDILAKRGIYDYLVVCDESNNTPARIDRNELWVDIAIEPVKAVEFIYIPIRLKNTGEISGS